MLGGSARTMKTFFAYALVVIGVPVFVGLLFGSIVSLPIAWGLRRSTTVSTTSLLYLEAFNGFGAVLAATLLFRLFALPLGLAVFIIMAAWVTFYFLSYKQSFRALFSCLAGMLIGWFVVPRIF